MIDYAKLAARVRPMRPMDPKDQEDMRNRSRLSTALAETLKLLDGEGAGKDAYSKLLAHAWYNWFPEYFFVRPASSTGKYHPAFANGRDGLVLHTLAVVRVADMLLGCYEPVHAESDMRNQVIAAAFMHDMLKYGDPDRPSDFMVHEHPVLAADFLLHPDTVEICGKFGIPIKDVRLVSSLVRTHMGRFTTSRYSDVILDEPVTGIQRLVFIADYLASRKENDIVKDVIS